MSHSYSPLKSLNVMVMGDRITGKLGDCGESRRLDLNSTMTQIGSPLWAAVSPSLVCRLQTFSMPGSQLTVALGDPSTPNAQPELLSGKRYCEDVDTYALGIVLLEISMRELPYGKERRAFKARGGKGRDANLMIGISKGLIRPELYNIKCRTYGIGRELKKREF